MAGGRMLYSALVKLLATRDSLVWSVTFHPNCMSNTHGNTSSRRPVR